MNDWQPIATAPKDKTEILLFIPQERGSMPEMVTAKWIGTCWWLVQGGSYADDFEIEGEPTHWMPLPEPPN